MGRNRGVRSAVPRRRAFARRDRAVAHDFALRSRLLLASFGHRARDRRGAPDRRAFGPSRRTCARRQSLARQGLRTLSLLPRAHAEDHLLPDHDHVVRRRARLEGRHGRDFVLLPHRAVRSRRHASDRSGADPRGKEFSRRDMADGGEDLFAGDAPSDRQRRAIGARCRGNRHAARGDQIVQPRDRLSRHQQLQHVREPDATGPGVAG